MTEAHSTDETASFILESEPTEDQVVLGVHGTDYLIELTPLRTIGRSLTPLIHSMSSQLILHNVHV